MFPIYTLCNMIAALTVDELKTLNPDGGVYGLEAWKNGTIGTIGAFFGLACVQTLFFYCSCVIIEKIWPKRAEEKYDEE